MYSHLQTDILHYVYINICICVFACVCVCARNIKGGSIITVLLTSCFTGLDQSVLQIKTKIVSYHTAYSKPVKQEVNGTVILTPLVFPGVCVCVCVCVWVFACVCLFMHACNCCTYSLFEFFQLFFIFSIFMFACILPLSPLII